MREITTHRATPADDLVRIETMDDPKNGVHARYDVLLRNHGNWGTGLPIKFQSGSAPEAPVGPNGVTNESLLAVVIDRLQCFQKGPLACRENAVAINHLETALLWLQQRSRGRAARGVAGTQSP